MNSQNSYPDILDYWWGKHLEPRLPDAPTVISTFAGGGGSSLGYSMAGFKELLAVEWDDNAVATFGLNFPDVPIYHGDIAKLSVGEVLERTGIQPGDLDIFDGSPPCQGVSTSGKRQLDDARNQLFREYVRLLRGLRPKVFVMENVSGMVKGKMKLLFAEIMRELKASGYQVSTRLMNTKYFLVPQSRQRLIFIGVRNDLGIKPSHPKAQDKTIAVREAWVGISEFKQDEGIDHVWVDEVSRKTKWIARASMLRFNEKLIPNKPTGKRLHPDEPCPTIMKNAPPGCPPYVRNSMIHPFQSRTPSIREMARCQSFPDSFRFVGALNYGMARIGNSVPPLFMRAIALHLRETVLDKLPESKRLDS